MDISVYTNPEKPNAITFEGEAEIIKHIGQDQGLNVYLVRFHGEHTIKRRLVKDASR